MTRRQSETAFSVLIDGDSDPAVIRVRGELDSDSAREFWGVPGRNQTEVLGV